MENKKKRNNALMLSVLGVIALVLVTAGVTYAFFNYRKEGKTVNTIKTGTITFNSTNDTGTVFTIQDALPTTDATGSTDTTNKFVFDVTSTNTGAQPINYIITAKKSADSTLAEDQIKVYLKDVSSVTQGTGTNYTFTTSGADTTYATFASLNAPTATYYTQNASVGTGEVEKLLYAGTVPAQTAVNGYDKDFEFRMWLNGEDGTTQADYSPYEFMLMDANETYASDATYSTYSVTGCKSSLGAYINAVDETACTTAGGTWVTSITIPQATSTTPIDAEQAIRAGNFITSTAYYALPATHCSDGTRKNQTTCLETTGNTWTATAAREDYERIAYVYKNSTTNTNLVLTQSQAVTLGKATVDAFENYTFTGTLDNQTQKRFETISDKSFEVTEQYYQINGQQFKVKINVYANATVQQ